MRRQIQLAGTKKFEFVIRFSCKFIRICTYSHLFDILLPPSSSFSGKEEEGGGKGDERRRMKCRIDRRMRKSNGEYDLLAQSTNAGKRQIEGWIEWNPREYMALIYHIGDVFNCPIVYFESSPQLPIAHFNSLVDWLVSRQDRIQTFEIGNLEMDEDTVKRTLEKITVTRVLGLFVQMCPGFEYNFKSQPTEIQFPCCPWFTLQSLLSISFCIIIRLWDPMLTNQDMNMFFEKWKRGEFSRLQYLFIQSDILDPSVSIAGIQPPIYDPNNTDLSEITIGLSNMGFRNGVEIRSDDGTRAMIKMESGDLRFIVRN
uniref:FBA_2 domain-containing protein n=1 Tax=Caenorhabditis tropicalis TaxID=1561998 RepID=A0A1I7TIN1_9PELO